MTKKIAAIIVSLFLFTGACYAQRLDKFVSETGKVVRINKEQSIPYREVITYFGYIKPGSEPDEIRDSLNYYNFYFWLSDSVSEIGVRIISPVPDVVMPDRGDLTSENYFENEKNKENYFDTWISLERADSIFTKGEALLNQKKINWMLLGSNDDSPELFVQPSGKNSNSLVRIVSNPVNRLSRGLYKIAFTSPKQKELKGSYILQLGMTSKLQETKLVKKLPELK
ncbi:MAG: LipL32 family surface lipoprotein [Bacteroidia bacterium]